MLSWYLYVNVFYIENQYLLLHVVKEVGGEIAGNKVRGGRDDRRREMVKGEEVKSRDGVRREMV